MVTKTVDITEAQEQFSELLGLALSGTEIIIVSGDRPLARLTPISAGEPSKRVAGLHTGKSRIADDFDAPLPDQFWLGEH